MTDILWIIILIGLPSLAGMWGADRVTARYGADAWRNPGGWKFPRGEVTVFGLVAVSWILIGVVAVVIS